MTICAGKYYRHMLTLEEHIRDAAEFVQQAGRIVALTGAGISTESGIPDFRSPGSVWLQTPPVNYRDFLTKPEARRQYWETRRNLSTQVANARPNAAHHALAELERRSKLLGLITQNFDGLHQDAGHRADRVVELHGTSREAACTLCGARSPIAEIQQRVNNGEAEPVCAVCGGYMKSATILFGQKVPENDLKRARSLAEECDLFLVVGSSLKVVPAATLPRIALRREVPLIIINLQPTSLDGAADVVIHEKAGEVLPRIIDMIAML